MLMRKDIRKENTILHLLATWYGPILTWPDTIYKQYLSDLGLGLKLLNLEHMRQDMKYFAAFAMHLVYLDICCCVPGAESPAWSSVSPMSRSAPPLSVSRHLQQREISAESTLTAALQPATGALKLQWVLQHESCSRNCTQQVAPSPPIGSGHAWSPSLGEPSAPYKHIRWSEERKVEKTNRDIVVCEADLYILMLYVSQSVYLVW